MNIEEGQTTGTCEWCGDEEVPIWENTKRCDDCDSEFYYCSICNEHQHTDNLCRHISRSESGVDGIIGSGAWYSEFADPPAREALFRFFDLMPAGFVNALRAAIISGRFYTFAVMPMIGGGGHIELHGFPYDQSTREYEHAFVEIGSDWEDGEETADAYHWLSSLYEKKTLLANWVTVRWIDEYRGASGKLSSDPVSAIARQTLGISTEGGLEL